MFGPFRLSVGRRELLKNGVPIQLSSRPFDLLLALVERQGNIATKDELLAEVWPGTVVEENNLQVQILALRKIFGEEAEGSRYLLTVPGRGYRFVAPVERPDEAPSAPSSEPVAIIRGTGAVAAARQAINRCSAVCESSGDPEQDYFADSMAEEILTALSRCVAPDRQSPHSVAECYHQERDVRCDVRFGAFASVKPRILHVGFTSVSRRIAAPQRMT